MLTIYLIKSPKEIFRGTIDIIAAGIIRKVVAQWRAGKLFAEEIDFVEEKNDTGAYKPPGIEHRVEEY